MRMLRYVGGPLDGKEIDATGWTDADLAGGGYEIVDGWTDRAHYEPDPGGDVLVWRYRGPVPD
ncbi:MAG: hypothetical protein HOW97_02325 [Catenulispora sp.]|nr:hypothetical protein [Catenulispora sp.]